MTAEVGVLNRIGVALAADSAVTIGPTADKIYTSTDKIFHLSCTAPVGAMVFGNANLVGLPWETIIKAYRSRPRTQQFDSLHEYADDFLAFLGSEPDMFPAERQNRHTWLVVASLFEDLQKTVKERFFEEIRAGKDVQDDDLAKLLHEEVGKWLRELRKIPFLVGFSKSDLVALRSRYGGDIRDIAKIVFDGLTLPAKTTRALQTLAVESLARANLGGMKSGLVIAGFGDKEYTPSLISFEIEEMALDRLRYVEAKKATVTSDVGAWVIPFAQAEMVFSFMEGIDARLLDWMEGSTLKLFASLFNEMVATVGQTDAGLAATLKAQVAPEVLKLARDLLKGWEEQRSRFWKPVMNTTAALPKDELAAMAEALVNLTKFRRRVTPVRETVGGPIDVALITKGDGFIWVKRKHYFAPGLNPRVMARYQQGG